MLFDPIQILELYAVLYFSLCTSNLEWIKAHTKFLLQISYAISPILAFTVVGALRASLAAQ